MGRRPKEIPSDQKEDLRAALRDTETKPEFQRVLCLWLRAELGLTAEEIARAIGWKASTVRQFQSRFLRGEASIEGAGRGGRRRQHLTVEQEKALVTKETRSARRIDFASFKKAYEQQVGTHVADSTVYRLLKRHGLATSASKGRKDPRLA